MKLLVKNFNNLIKNTIFKAQNKTNNILLVSKFNKYLITLISLLFLYLFYLSIPVLYDKNWVQKNIEDQLLKNFKINFSLSSDMSYRILPSPHYLVKDTKIIKEDDKTTSLAEIKSLKIFISQKNFLDKEKILLRHIKIDNANFILLKNDLKLIRDSTNNKFSNKKIEISKSNIFFKNESDEIISIIKISHAFLFQDEKNLLNLFNLKGEAFNIPFSFGYSKKFDYLKNTKINITANTLKINIFNIHNLDKNSENKGKNIISFLNSKINTSYKIENDIVMFNSINSKINNSKLDYDGKISINPFDLNFDVNLDNYDLRKFFNSNSILNELIKTDLLFNKNISMSSSMTTSSNSRNKIFQEAIINFNIVDGKLDINRTRLINNKIGLLELENSNLSFEDDRLILNTEVIITIKNSNELFSLLQTNKKFRKPIKNIFINLNYDFLSNKIEFNNVKINNKKISDELLRISEGFNEKELNNWNKSKRLLNSFFSIYEG
jgi:hypothetical protein